MEYWPEFLESKGMAMRTMDGRFAKEAAVCHGCAEATTTRLSVVRVCDRHTCNCAICKTHSVNVRMCTWREHTLNAATRFQQKRPQYTRNWRKVKKDPTLSRGPSCWELVEAAKMCVHAAIAEAPRIRQLLKLQYEHRNVLKKNVIVDFTQSVHRARITDGLHAPTLTAHCHMICAPLFASLLSVEQCFALQGIDMMGVMSMASMTVICTVWRARSCRVQSLAS